MIAAARARGLKLNTVSKDADVELMTHPVIVSEYHYLMSDTYRTALFSLEAETFKSL